jgi:CheY-like chemotaxis protein
MDQTLSTPPRFAKAPSSDRPRILLAEDNLVNPRVATCMLEKLGCQVDVVTSGQEALAASAMTANAM